MTSATQSITESQAFNMDCMEGMRQYPDKHFDLAVVDPPYGIGKNWKKDTASKFYKHSSAYDNAEIPSQEYFNELFRVSKHQIIWGANYYWNYLKPTSNIIWWDKQIVPEKHLRSAGELAWTSVTRWPANSFSFSWNGCAVSEPRSGIHPHEKPISLYSWLYKNYLPNGGKVIDTHLGGGSNRIAADKAGNIDFVGYEIDTEYFEAQEKRWKAYKAQTRLF